MSDFRLRHKKKASRLSNHIWEIKNQARREGRGSVYPVVKWSTISRPQPFQKGQRTCQLCLTEKFMIAKERGRHMLNKRSEIAKRCRHREKCMLAGYFSTKTVPPPAPPEEDDELLREDEDEGGGVQSEGEEEEIVGTAAHLDPVEEGRITRSMSRRRQI